MGAPNSKENGKAIILVVERDPHVRELDAHFLHQAGYAVEFEQNGESALEQARRVVPDIVIAEILVPTLDGLALCRLSALADAPLPRRRGDPGSGQHRAPGAKPLTTKRLM